MLTPFCSSVPLFIGFVSAGMPLGLRLLYGPVGWVDSHDYLVFGCTIATVARVHPALPVEHKRQRELRRDAFTSFVLAASPTPTGPPT